MTKYLVIENHPDFATASRRAIELFMRFHDATVVQRNQSSGWDVCGSSFLLTQLVIEDVSQRDCIEYGYQDQEGRLDRIEGEYFIEFEPANKPDERHRSGDDQHESLIGWGSGDHDHLSQDTEDWSDGLDDSDSSYWEDHMGGPDY